MIVTSLPVSALLYTGLRIALATVAVVTSAGATPNRVVSGVVESPFGLHVILIDDIQAATPKQLSEVREDIVSEITKQIAADRFATMANKLTKLIYDQRDSLKPISDELGLPLHQVDGLSRDGLLHTEQRQPGSPAYTDLDRTVLGNPKVRLTAFSTEVLKDKFNFETIKKPTITKTDATKTSFLED